MFLYQFPSSSCPFSAEFNTIEMAGHIFACMHGWHYGTSSGVDTVLLFSFLVSHISQARAGVWALAGGRNGGILLVGGRGGLQTHIDSVCCHRRRKLGSGCIKIWRWAAVYTKSDCTIGVECGTPSVIHLVGKEFESIFVAHCEGKYTVHEVYEIAKVCLPRVTLYS